MPQSFLYTLMDALAKDASTRPVLHSLANGIDITKGDFSMKRISNIAVLFITSILMAGNAAAQNAADYPSKPVTLVIAAAPGGATDTEIRMYLQRLTEILGKPFVADYKPGAGGTIAPTFVSRAAPDGHIILASNSGFTTSAAFYSDLQYDPIKDFQPVVLLTKRNTLMLASNNAPFNNFKEYLAYARANPGKVNFGANGGGSIHHLVAAHLHDVADVKVAYVQYKVSQAKTVDLLAGRIDAMFSTFITSAKNARSGRMKMIAVMNPERSPVAPDWATISEQGMPVEVEYPSWLGIQAPARTPMPIVNKLNGTMQKIMREPEVAKRFEADSMIVIGSNPDQFRQHMVKEIARWKAIAAKTGIQGEAD